MRYPGGSLRRVERVPISPSSTLNCNTLFLSAVSNRHIRNFCACIVNFHALGRLQTPTRRRYRFYSKARIILGTRASILSEVISNTSNLRSDLVIFLFYPRPLCHFPYSIIIVLCFSLTIDYSITDGYSINIPAGTLNYNASILKQSCN